MTETGGIYAGMTIAEAEYRDGWHRGAAYAEHDRDNYTGGMWAEIARAQDEAAVGDYRTRTFWLGWLRGYREVVR